MQSSPRLLQLKLPLDFKVIKDGPWLVAHNHYTSLEKTLNKKHYLLYCRDGAVAKKVMVSPVKNYSTSKFFACWFPCQLANMIFSISCSLDVQKLPCRAQVHSMT